jgi:hypothetical protein
MIDKIVQDADGYPLLGPYFQAQGYVVKWDRWKRWHDDAENQGWRMYSLRMAGPVPPAYLRPGQDHFELDEKRAFLSIVPEYDNATEGTPTTYIFTTFALTCKVEHLDAMIRLLQYTPATMLLCKKPEDERTLHFEDWDPGWLETRKVSVQRYELGVDSE